MERPSAVRAVFWSVIAVGAVVASELFVPLVTEFLRGPMLFLLPPTVFSALGASLTVLALRGGAVGRLKRYLLLTGISAAAFVIFVMLHNVFYALAQLSADAAVLSRLAEVLHVAFFLAAVIACPLGFVMGASLSVVVFLTQRGGPVGGPGCGTRVR